MISDDDIMTIDEAKVTVCEFNNLASMRSSKV